MIKRHQKGESAGNRGGGIIDKEAFIDISNVQLIDPQSGKPTRVSIKSRAMVQRRGRGASGHSLEK
jgi:large subunit ribosomal protein L24